jgi:hypothetical protein
VAEMTVRVEGTVATTSSGGTGGSAANPSFTSIVENGNTADVSVPGSVTQGYQLAVTTGALASVVSLNAVASTGAGAVVDFGSAKAQISLAITASAGVSAGAVALEVSQDNTNWFRITPAATQSAPGVTEATKTGAWRYARGNVTTAITGGTVSATIMGA